MAKLWLDRHPQYLRIAQETHALAHDVLEVWPSETIDAITHDPLPLMIHAVCRSQSLRLDALLHLDERGLAFVGTSFVRLAYDEIIWLVYLATEVSREDRLEVLRVLAGRDVAHRYRHQRDYFGDKANAVMSLTSDADEDIECQLDGITASMHDLSERLGWNKASRRTLFIPSMKFFARKVGLEKDHDFFATSTSQFMHFSAFNLLRGVSRNDDGTPQLGRPFIERRDAGYALGWCANHLLNILILCRSWDTTLANALHKRMPYWESRAKRLMNELDSVGPPPIIEGHDFLAGEA